MVRIYNILFFILANMILGYAPVALGYTKPDMSKAVPYEVQELNHGVFLNRGTVYMEIIIPTHLQSTPEQYAHTVIKVAWDTINELSEQYPEEDLQVITVMAYASPHALIASAVFAKDKRGFYGDKYEWLVKTMKGKSPPAEYFEVDKLWWELQDDYRIPDPQHEDCYVVDADTLAPIVAKKLNIPLDMVHFPTVRLREYLRK